MTVLSDKLLKLQYEGLISKKIYPEIPQSRITLTDRARELKEILEELGDGLSAANSL
jgi:DNA-binding HxlR family transcriptional regulator